MEGRRPPFAWLPTSLSFADVTSGLHLVIWLPAVVLYTGLVGVHPLCGGVIEVPISQASGLSTVLDLERTEGRMRAENVLELKWGENELSAHGTSWNLREIQSVGSTHDGRELDGVKFSFG